MDAAYLRHIHPCLGLFISPYPVSCHRSETDRTDPAVLSSAIIGRIGLIRHVIGILCALNIARISTVFGTALGAVFSIALGTVSSAVLRSGVCCAVF